MIRHLVFLKFKAEVSEEQISEVEKGLGALPGIISEIKSYEFGRDMVHSERSYDFALVSVFEDMESLNAYQIHPDHMKVVKFLKEICEDIRVVDYRF